jgi:hypothetical protein
MANIALMRIATNTCASSLCLQHRSLLVCSTSICSFHPKLHSRAFAVPLPPTLSLRGALHLLSVSHSVAVYVAPQAPTAGCSFFGLKGFLASSLSLPKSKKSRSGITFLQQILSKQKNRALPHACYSSENKSSVFFFHLKKKNTHAQERAKNEYLRRR